MERLVVLTSISQPVSLIGLLVGLQTFLILFETLNSCEIIVKFIKTRTVLDRFQDSIKTGSGICFKKFFSDD